MFQIGQSACTSCNGRGHKWHKSSIISRDGINIATTYKDAGRCDTCGGSGQIGLYFVTRRLAQILIAFAVGGLIVLSLIN
jgi:uncharacterized protein with PIN domain